MNFIFGTKQNMVQYFDEDGRAYSGTLIKATPIVVTQVKTKDVDGYDAVQVGFGVRKAKNIAKPQKGHVKELGNFVGMKEIRMKSGNGEAKTGDSISLDTFAKNDKVTVTAISKGKGFQGVVKRHGFAGGPRSHGQKHSEREPGSIGGGLRTHVPKGMRMAGRMGSDKITVKNLKVLAIDNETNEILVSGAIPGRRGTVIEIRKQ
jgi:large subunit ribosomal protein L3